MGCPPRKYIRNLRDNPDPRLISYIAWLRPGVYTVAELWDDFNDRQGFYGEVYVFRYAVLHAGLVEETPNGKLLKP